MDRTVVIGDLWLTLILGAFIPLVAELLTQRFTTGWPKTLVLVALSALTSVAQWAQARHGVFTWADLLASFLLALGTAFTTHNTVWKPVKVTGDDGVIQRATPNLGIPGPRKAPELVGPAGAEVPAGVSYAQGGLITAEQARLAGPTVAEALRTRAKDDYDKGGLR